MKLLEEVRHTLRLKRYSYREQNGVRNHADNLSDILPTPVLSAPFLSGRPSSPPTLAGDQAGTQLFNHAGQPGDTEGTAAGLGNLRDPLRSQSASDRVDVPGHRLLSPVLAFGPRRWSTFLCRSHPPSPSFTLPDYRFGTLSRTQPEQLRHAEYRPRVVAPARLAFGQPVAEGILALAQTVLLQ
jgi:hypothetical protein